MAVQTILLVDGYNVIGSWPKLVRLRDVVSLEAARNVLIGQLVDFASFRGYYTVLVFDSQMVASPLARAAETTNLEICFTDYEQTADSFIEKSSYQLLRAGRQVMVATSDRAQQLLVLAQGASWLSAQQLLKEVKAARSQMDEQLQQRRRQPGRKLADHLDPLVLERFAQWRRGE